MKPILLVALIFTLALNTSAQVRSTPKDDAPPAEYAAYMTKLYTEHLNLDATQKEQAYNAILYKRRSLDSIKTNNVTVTTPALWALNMYVDTKFKDILTSDQYTRYEDMRNMFIVHIPIDKMDKK